MSKDNRRIELEIVCRTEVCLKICVTFQEIKDGNEEKRREYIHSRGLSRDRDRYRDGDRETETVTDKG